VSFAQKPKSAVETRAVKPGGRGDRARGKLTDLDATLSVQQYIVRFDISVNDGLTMQVTKPLARLGNGPSACRVGVRREQPDLHGNTRNLVFLQSVVFDYVGQSTTFHIFHYNPKFVVLDQIRIEEVHDIGVLRFLHNQDLVDDEFFAWLVREVHLLDSDLLSRGESLGDVNVPGSAVNSSK